MNRTSTGAAIVIVGIVALWIFNSRFNYHGAYVSTLNFLEQNQNKLHEVTHFSAQPFGNAAAWNKDGSLLAVLNDSGSKISLRETKTWKLVNQFQNPGTNYDGNSLSFLDNGDLLVPPVPTYKNADNPGQLVYSLAEWDAQAGKLVRLIPSGGIPENSLTPISITKTYKVSWDGKYIAGVGGTGVYVYDANTATRTGNTTHHIIRIKSAR